MSRFPQTQCSQCGCDLGPGDEGVSHCSGHSKWPDGLTEAQRHELAKFEAAYRAGRLPDLPSCFKPLEDE
jgi:hypothetical protein